MMRVPEPEDEALQEHRTSTAREPQTLEDQLEALREYPPGFGLYINLKDFREQETLTEEEHHLQTGSYEVCFNLAGRNNTVLHTAWKEGEAPPSYIPVEYLGLLTHEDRIEGIYVRRRESQATKEEAVVIDRALLQEVGKQRWHASATTTNK